MKLRHNKVKQNKYEERNEFRVNGKQCSHIFFIGTFEQSPKLLTMKTNITGQPIGRKSYWVTINVTYDKVDLNIT